jgi:hypothetical protein
VYAGGRPSLLQQDLKIGIAQRPELVDETDAGKELRVPRESLFDSGHADEHHAQAALIEDGAQLLQTVHRQTICFIDNYKGSRIRDSLEPGLVLVERVVVCWLKRQGMVGPVISVIPMLDAPSLVPTAKNIKRRPLFRTCRSLCYAAEKSASCPDVILYPRWCVDDFRCEEDSVSIGLASEASAFQRSKGMIFWIRL